LELDKQAWWWYWDLEREGIYFQLLSPDELARLHELIGKYGKNVEASVGAIGPLWRFLSSSAYLSSSDSQKQITPLHDGMNERSQQLSDERTQHLAKEMAAIFARSNFEPAQ